MREMLELLRAEREKQVSKGFDAKHDANHFQGELAIAVTCLLYSKLTGDPEPPESWPWHTADWQRLNRHDYEKTMLICAAMLVAEMERFKAWKPMYAVFHLLGKALSKPIQPEAPTP